MLIFWLCILIFNLFVIELMIFFKFLFCCLGKLWILILYFLVYCFKEFWFILRLWKFLFSLLMVFLCCVKFFLYFFIEVVIWLIVVFRVDIFELLKCIVVFSFFIFLCRVRFLVSILFRFDLMFSNIFYILLWVLFYCFIDIFLLGCFVVGEEFLFDVLFSLFCCWWWFLCVILCFKKFFGGFFEDFIWEDLFFGCIWGNYYVVIILVDFVKVL